jgi:uncharacterized protein (TIGR03067 family)
MVSPVAGVLPPLPEAQAMKLAHFLVPVAVLVFATQAVAQPNPLIRTLPAGAASTETLGKLLRDLAFEPKALSPDVFQVSVVRDHWPVHVMLSLSTDGRRIWMESKFAPVEEPDRVPASAWKKLLEANEKIGPAHFTFEPGDRRIHLYKPFENQNLTSERLQREIEQFDLTVRKTQEFWRGDNFKPVLPLAESAKANVPDLSAPKVEVPALPASREVDPAERLMGEWKIVELHLKGRRTPDDIVNSRKPSLTVRAARDGEFGTAGKGKVVAELRTGSDGGRTVCVDLSGVTLTGARPIDFIDEREKKEQGIYKLEGETLTLCFAAPGEPRPTEFNSSDAKSWTIVLKKK